MIANAAFRERPKLAWRGGRAAPATRLVAEEKAVALTYSGSTYAVMMATPADLEDFGVGFSITEGIVEQADGIGSIELIDGDLGVEVRMWLDGDRTASLAARRRATVGPVGCGLCGIESLEQAARTAPQVASETVFHACDLIDAMRALAPLQHLNQATRAAHAAAFWRPSVGIGLVREDVGRHNALDKLAGALMREGGSLEDGFFSDGAVLLTSRVSVEMVQKTAMIGAPLLIAVSAPTTLAIRIADAAGITLVGIARDDGYEVFTHPGRIAFPGKAPPKTSDEFELISAG
jgi:FdhD protein